MQVAPPVDAGAAPTAARSSSAAAGAADTPAVGAGAGIPAAAGTSSLDAVGSTSPMSADFGADAGADARAAAVMHDKPAGSSRTGSCALPEPGAAPARADLYGQHAGHADGLRTHAAQQAPQQLQQSCSSSACAAVLAPQEPAGASTGCAEGCAEMTAVEQHAKHSMQQLMLPALLPQQQHIQDSKAQQQQQALAAHGQPSLLEPQVPDFLATMEGFIPSPVVDHVDEPDWQQLLACWDGGHAAGQDMDVLPDGFFAGNLRGGTDGAAGSNVISAHPDGGVSRNVYSAWHQQQQQPVQEPCYGTISNDASRVAAFEALSTADSAGKAGLQQGHSNSSSHAHAGSLTPPVAAVPVALPAVGAGCFQLCAEHDDMGAFGGFSCAHAAGTGLDTAAEAFPALCAAAGVTFGPHSTDTGACMGLLSTWPSHGLGAAVADQVKPVMGAFNVVPKTGTEQLSPTASGVSAEPAASAAGDRAVGRVGILSCIQTPSQAVAVIDSILQCLQDLSMHLQYAQQKQQQHPYSSTMGCSGLLGSMSDWLQSAWYIEVLAAGDVSAAALPGTTAAAITAAKAAEPDVTKPNRVALQLMEQLLIICTDALSSIANTRCSGKVALAGAASADMYVFEVLQELQQGVLALEDSLGMVPAEAAFSCAQLLQAYWASKYSSGCGLGVAGAASTLWALAQVM